MDDLRDVRGPSAQRPAHSSRSSRGLQNSFKLLDDRNISRSSGSKAAHKPAPQVRFDYLCGVFFVLNFNRSFLCDLPEEHCLSSSVLLGTLDVPEVPSWLCRFLYRFLITG